MEEQKCSICNNFFPKSLEYFGKHKLRGLDTYCKSCRKKRTLENYYKNKEKWNETSRRNKKQQRERINNYKENKTCNKCGENRNWLLDFHHINSKNKSFQISQGEGYGWKRILEEIKKCILLCSNCHRDFHYQEKIKNITIQEYLNEE